jgi:hypothetical protein
LLCNIPEQSIASRTSDARSRNNTGEGDRGRRAIRQAKRAPAAAIATGPATTATAGAPCIQDVASVVLSNAARRRGFWAGSHEQGYRTLNLGRIGAGRLAAELALVFTTHPKTPFPMAAAVNQRQGGLDTIPARRNRDRHRQVSGAGYESGGPEGVGATGCTDCHSKAASHGGHDLVFIQVK